MDYPPPHYLVPGYQLLGIPTIASKGQEGDDNAIEDSEPGELQGKIKDLIELAIRMVDVAKATSELHRRMT